MNKKEIESKELLKFNIASTVAMGFALSHPYEFKRRMMEKMSESQEEIGIFDSLKVYESFIIEVLDSIDYWFYKDSPAK